ncbi:hypothetical protein [Burkholderia territorii]|uniref:hypothetical protein n=1 Tax=Burkholderia territorii TaxID=1503055 RepID=UPI0012D8D6C2|nr:hypothetical protein [Burkholderia territorii]
MTATTGILPSHAQLRAAVVAKLWMMQITAAVQTAGFPLAERLVVAELGHQPRSDLDPPSPPPEGVPYQFLQECCGRWRRSG